MNCEPIRPLLYRIAEGEASPEEAIEVARHIPACTACRILLAREQRLAQLLECDLADLNVDEAFVESVMSTLPDSPRPRKSRRGLKLAGLFGALVSSAALGGRGLFAPPVPELQVPVMDGGLLERTAGDIAGLLRALLLSMDSLFGLGRDWIPTITGAGGLLIGGFAIGCLTLTAAAAAGLAGTLVFLPRGRSRSAAGE
jgi:hypothetical protein